MELYTIDHEFPESLDPDAVPTFNRLEVIDKFTSLVWTERFIEAGDITVTLPAIHKNLKFLRPGNVLGCRGSRELMLLETRSIEEGLVTATGKTLESYFNQRYIKQEIVMAALKGGDIMKGVVNAMQDQDYGYGTTRSITGLRVADPDPDETEYIFGYTETIPHGPVYDTLVALGKKYPIGQSVIWTKIVDGDHELVYTTRQGVDRTGEILFSPKLDNLGGAKELLSIANAKNVFISITPKWVNPDIDTPVFFVSWNYDEHNRSVFRERWIELDNNDISEDSIEAANEVEKMQKLYRMLDDRTTAAYAKNKRTRIVDGEVTPETRFKYKQDYDLGDKVSIQGDYGDIIYGVVTEYIRSQDETGERSYPTVSANPDPWTGPGA